MTLVAFTKRLSAIAILSLAVSAARADVLFNSGSQTFAATNVQYGRLVRDGAASTWVGPKAFPGVSGAPATRGYEVFSVNSWVYPYLQIEFDGTAALFVSAYLGSYAPVTAAPSYGLDQNYLGDAGSSGNAFPGDPAFFQIQVAPMSTVLFVVTEVNQNGGAGAAFGLMVEGFFDTDYTDRTNVPEPGAIALFGSVALALAWRMRRNRAA